MKTKAKAGEGGREGERGREREKGRNTERSRVANRLDGSYLSRVCRCFLCPRLRVRCDQQFEPDAWPGHGRERKIHESLQGAEARHPGE